MIINFKNQHIFFALANIWNDLHYKFKSHINELVSMNSDNEFIQLVDVPEAIIIQIYHANSKQAQGIAKYINVDMQAALVPQLMEASNMPEVMLGDEEPNEASRILMACMNIDTVNAQYREAIIISGKTQILAD